MEYVLKQGNVESTRQALFGNRFSVRVLPDMEGVDSSLLPFYANFFADNNTAYEANQKVWVLCSKDYEVGFIVGRSQVPLGNVIGTDITKINEIESLMGLPLSTFPELSIFRFSGSSFHFENNFTGTSGVVYTNGTITIFGSNGAFWLSPAGKNFNLNVTQKGDLLLQGKVKTEEFSKTSEKVDGESKETVGKKIIESLSPTTIQSSGEQMEVSMSSTKITSGDEKITTVGKKEESIGQGETRTILTGGKSETIIAGGHTEVVAQGDYTLAITTGTITLTGVGINITSLKDLNLSSAIGIKLTAPTITTPNGVVAPTGSGGLCALPACLFTGAPHVGNTLVGV